MPKITNSPEKKPKKITLSYLENAGLFYLQRYASSSANFRRVMLQKIKKSCLYHKTDFKEYVPMLDTLIERYISSGLLNDASFSKAKSASLHRQGKSSKHIRQKLMLKGLPKEYIDQAILEIGEDEQSELTAARILIKKKKLGPFRKEKNSKKDMSVLARAGFSYATAKKALHIAEED